MKNKYLKYSLEEFLDDRQFVSWVLRKRDNDEWLKLIDNHPEIKSKIGEAREIISLLSDSYEVLDEDCVLEMWQNIERFEKSHIRKVRTIIKLRRGLGWAASVLLIISLSVFGFLYLNEKRSGYRFASSESAAQNSEARLILSDGEEIVLTGNNSIISVDNRSESVRVNNSVIVLSDKKTGKVNEVQMNKVVIPYGKRSELLLADGTKVWLNAGTHLAFPLEFTEKNREVFLEGEAYFEVVKNDQQPFIVNAGELDIEVLGTHFVVSAYPGENTEAVLLEGCVAVSNPSIFGLRRDEVILEPNQKASFDNQNRTIAVSNEPETDMYVAWTRGWLEFSKESLQSVFNKVQRYYNIEITVPPNFPYSEQISGKLDLKESLEDVMIVLGGVAKIDYKISGDTVYVDEQLKRSPMK